jgi:hypothetical protein
MAEQRKVADIVRLWRHCSYLKFPPICNIWQVFRKKYFDFSRKARAIFTDLRQSKGTQPFLSFPKKLQRNSWLPSD